MCVFKHTVQLWKNIKTMYAFGIWIVYDSLKFYIFFPGKPNWCNSQKKKKKNFIRETKNSNFIPN